MKTKLRLFLACLPFYLPLVAGASPSAYDVVGTWESTVEFGKFKFNLVVKVAKTADGKIDGKISLPEQGAREIPINALLYNSPAVRWEIDPFNTVFNGKLNDSGTEIGGTFEEGPGGRPVTLVFKRVNPSELREVKLSYAFAAGETRDIRGYWLGSIESQRGAKVRLGLKIGRAPDGSFAATLDRLDQGALDLPATAIKSSGPDITAEWRLFQEVFEGKLSDDGSRLTGQWKQRNQPTAVAFERLERPATVLPSNVSFKREADRPDDIRGDWQGALAVGGRKLRLLVKIGQTPEGAFAGTLASLDQGGTEIPISTLGYTNPVLRMEWKGIGGVFQGKLNPGGTALEGTWEQGGTALELHLDRTELRPETQRSQRPQ